jgi:hypothetical protein
LLLVAGGGAWWTRRHLSKIFVTAVERAWPGLTISARSVALSRPGELRFESIRLRVAGADQDAFSVRAATIHFGWAELSRHFIRDVTLERPQVLLDDRTIESLNVAMGGGKAAVGDVPWQVGRISIVGGGAVVDLAAWPRLSLDVSAEIPAAHSAGVTAPARVRLGRVRIQARGEQEEAVFIPTLSASFVPGELREARIRELRVDSPRIAVNDALLKLLPRPAVGNEPAPAWRFDHLAIEKGEVRVDVSTLPRLRGGFAIHADAAPGHAEETFAVDIAHFSARLREDASELLSIAAARVVASPGDLQAKRIRELTVQDPHLQVTDAAVALLQSKPDASGSATAPGPAAGWTLNRVLIKGGQARVDISGAPLAECGFGLHMANAVVAPDGPDELQSLEIRDLALRPRDQALEPFLSVPSVRAEFRVPELLRTGRIARLQVEHLDFRYNSRFREMIDRGGKPRVTPTAAANPAAAGPPGPPISITECRLVDGQVHLNDLGLGIPPIDFRLNTAFRDLALSTDAGAAGHELQSVELSQIALSSPLDPFFHVLKLDSLFVRFTLAGLWRREIEEVEIIHPVIAIGPDLFWYVDQVQKNAAGPPHVATLPDMGPSWSVRRFNATSGQLVLALEGQRSLAVPMPFESHAEDLNFRHLADLRLKLAIDMPEQDYHYPGYELSLLGVRGRLEFSLPPKEKANNVVNTLHLREIRWKNYRTRESFLDVTYDVRGIYGHFGGKAYTGLFNGQFNFLLDDQSSWNGWISGEHIDLKQVTGILAPEKFSLDSPANFRLSLSAHATEFEQVAGDFAASKPGRLQIRKLNDLIEALPADWSGLKRGLARISLEALRDFAYEAARGDFHFHHRTGALHLDLRGAAGSRRITVQVHDDDEPGSPPPSIVATRP